jgi:hypothetical protein
MQQPGINEAALDEMQFSEINAASKDKFNCHVLYECSSCLGEMQYSFQG